MTLLGSVWIGLFFFLPLYQQQVLGMSPLATGAGQLPLAAANILGAIAAPRVSRRIGATATVTAPCSPRPEGCCGCHGSAPTGATSAMSWVRASWSASA